MSPHPKIAEVENRHRALIAAAISETLNKCQFLDRNFVFNIPDESLLDANISPESTEATIVLNAIARGFLETHILKALYRSEEQPAWTLSFIRI